MKRIWCITLVLTLALCGLSLPAGAVSVIIDGYSDGSLEENFLIDNDCDPYDVEVGPGDELRIPITADMFTWSDGREITDGEAIAHLFYLYNSKVKLKYQKMAGSSVLDYVQLEMGTFSGRPFYKFGTTDPTGKTAYISVNFIDDFADIQDKYFRYIIFLSIDGLIWDEFTLELTGHYNFDVDYVGAGQTEVDLSEGSIVEADEHIGKIKAYLGYGVTLETSMNKGQRYYGIAQLADSVDDIREEWPELYPDVSIIYKLRTTNLGGGLCKALIQPPDGRTYYVYGSDMQFLGMTGEKLPYSEHYFLSTTEMPAFEQQKYQDSLTRAPTTQQAAEAQEE